MWRKHVTRITKYTNSKIEYPSQFNGGQVSAFYDKITKSLLAKLAQPPTMGMRQLNSKISVKLNPISNKIAGWSRETYTRFERSVLGTPWRGVASKGVFGLIGLNVFAYMLLNSRFMKRRGLDGLSRADRHFIASRYNLSRGRVWCLPLSLFNHGDSLFQLCMNSFGLFVVGPSVELMFGANVLLSSFMFCGTIGALSELILGNHWCRGSSAGVTGIFGMSAFSAPFQILSVWGLFNVRAASLAFTLFGFETLVGLFGSGRSEMAHIAHATGIAAAIPILYYLRWFRM